MPIASDGRPADQQHAGDRAPRERRPRRGRWRSSAATVRRRRRRRTRSASAMSTRPPTAASGMSSSGSRPARAKLHSVGRARNRRGAVEAEAGQAERDPAQPEQRERGDEQQRRVAVHGGDGLRREHERGDHRRPRRRPTARAPRSSCRRARSPARRAGPCRRRRSPSTAGRPARGPRATVAGEALIARAFATRAQGPGRSRSIAALRADAARGGARASCASSRRAAAFGVPVTSGRGSG